MQMVHSLRILPRYLVFTTAIVSVVLVVPLMVDSRRLDGTAVVGWMAGLTAYADFLFNLGGVVLILPVFPLFFQVVQSLSADPSRQVAHAHTLFNGVTALLALPFLQHLAGLAWRGAGIGGANKNKLG